MTVEELALLLNTSKGAVYARLSRGGIPGAVRLGRTLRFDPRIIAQWLSANSASAGGQP
ncbi:helix-turn-helix domain-containing protein [Nannocystis bainbridge]|uniref:helix-turn-helix domain-containing protein n=1 Tax=Nannocystis bainbridge TaxID=2995303 RepID=UPI00358DD869